MLLKVIPENPGTILFLHSIALFDVLVIFSVEKYLLFYDLMVNLISYCIALNTF